MCKSAHLTISSPTFSFLTLSLLMVFPCCSVVNFTSFLNVLLYMYEVKYIFMLEKFIYPLCESPIDTFAYILEN